MWEKCQLRPRVLLGRVTPTTEIARIGHDGFEMPVGYPSRGERQQVVRLHRKRGGNHRTKHADLGLARV